MSRLICPLCAQTLAREEKWYTCPTGHRFDLAAKGYVHLLPANRMHSKTPGDDKGMASARNRFLSGGYYAPLLEALVALALRYTGSTPVVLDSGCGEGYYTSGICQALRQQGRRPQVVGIDLSKHALRWAAKRLPEGEFAVASVYRLPIATESVDLLLNCFSPLSLTEFQRVLRPGGVFLYVVPARRHLWEMKQVLYDRPYENKEEQVAYPGFRYLEIKRVRGRIHLPDQETVSDLFQMTPYYWKTPPAGAERLARRSELDVEIAFDIHVFQKA